MPARHRAAPPPRARRAAPWHAAALLALGCGGGGEAPPGPTPPTPVVVAPPGPPSGLAWSAPAVIPSPQGLAWRATGPALAAAPGGRLHLAFHTVAGPDSLRLLDVYHAEYADGRWGPAADVSRSPATASQAARVAVDAGGRVHVTWGEGPLGTGLPADPRDVVHAVRGAEPGAPWSAPETLAQSGGTRLTPPTALVPTPDGALHLTYEPDEPNGDRAPRHRRWAPGAGWAGSAFAAAAPYGSRDAGLAAGPDGRLWLPVVGPDQYAGAVGSGLNSVLITTSDDAGLTWAPLRVVQRAGARPSARTRAAVASDGAVHVAWLKGATGNPFPTEVWHSRSADGGRTWSPPAAVVPRAGAVRDLSLVADAHGGVHLGVTTAVGLLAPTGEAVYARWRDGRWSAPERLAGATRGPPRVELAVAGDTLHAVVLAGELGTDALVFPMYHVRAALR